MALDVDCRRVMWRSAAEQGSERWQMDGASRLVYFEHEGREACAEMRCRVHADVEHQDRRGAQARNENSNSCAGVMHWRAGRWTRARLLSGKLPYPFLKSCSAHESHDHPPVSRKDFQHAALAPQSSASERAPSQDPGYSGQTQRTAHALRRERDFRSHDASTGLCQSVVATRFANGSDFLAPASSAVIASFGTELVVLDESGELYSIDVESLDFSVDPGTAVADPTLEITRVTRVSAIFAAPRGVVLECDAELRATSCAPKKLKSKLHLLLPHPLERPSLVVGLAGFQEVLLLDLRLNLMVTWNRTLGTVGIWQMHFLSEGRSACSLRVFRVFEAADHLPEPQRGESASPPSVCFSHSFKGEALFACLIGGVVSVYEIVCTSDRDMAFFERSRLQDSDDEFVAVASIVASRHDALDMLVLRKSGALDLYIGGSCVVPGVNHLLHLPFENREGEQRIPVFTGFRNPVRSRITLICSDERALRINMARLMPHTDAIRDLVHTLGLCLPTDAMTQLWGDFLTRRLKYGLDDSADVESRFSEWKILSLCVLFFLPAETRNLPRFAHALQAVRSAPGIEARRIAVEPGSVPDHVPAYTVDVCRADAFTVLYALHLHYEQSRISRLRSHERSQWHAVCSWYAYVLDENVFLIHYETHAPIPCPWNPEKQDRRPGAAAATVNVPDSTAHLLACFTGRARRDYVFPNVCATQNTSFRSDPEYIPDGMRYSTTHLTYRLCRVADAYAREGPRSMLLALYEHGFSLEAIHALDLSIMLPIKDALWQFREQDNANGNASVEMRNSCSGFAKSESHRPLPEQAYVLIQREDFLQSSASGSAHHAAVGTGARTATPMLPGHGMLKLHTLYSSSTVQPGLHNGAARFAADHRLAEVASMLDSSRPVVFHKPVASAAAVADDEVTFENQNRLLLLLRRHLAYPVGRGAMLLGSSVSRTLELVEPLHVPELCLSGLVPGGSRSSGGWTGIAGDGTGGGALIALDQSPLPPNFLEWVEFHNGAAAGLCLGSADPRKDAMVSRSWIMTNRPNPRSDRRRAAAHAGVLLALGLTGHLPALKRTDWYQYLTQQHELTTIALMLGVASHKRGSMDAVTSKMMCLHLFSFNAGGFAQPDWAVSSLMQAAACVAAGMLFQETCNRLMVEGLLAELCARLDTQRVANRECVALCAAIGIGLICLGAGAEPEALKQCQLKKRFRLLIEGGNYAALARLEQQSSSTFSEEGSRSAPTYAGERDPFAPSKYQSAYDPAESQPVYDSGSIFIDATSPAALMALALMTMQCEDPTISELVPLPRSEWELDRMRPDHVLLRALVRRLNHWAAIEPTGQWLIGDLPAFLLPAEPEQQPKADAYDMDRFLDLDTPPSSLTQPGAQGKDSSCALRARAFAYTGAAIALGLKYAGSANVHVYTFLRAMAERFIAALQRRQQTPRSSEPAAYQMCLDSLVLTLGIVMSGTGNLECLRLLRALRVHGGGSKTYGSHQATHTAMGFLFLGNGEYAFQNSKQAAAYLLCSIYYRFPLSSTDNQFHLQALRHLYVLAAEPRGLEVYDVDSRLPCHVPVQIELDDTSNEFLPGSSLRLVTPGLLPDPRLIRRISVASPRYWWLDATIYSNEKWKKGNSAAVVVHLNAWTRKYELFLKRRAAYLSYQEDAAGTKSISSRFLGHADHDQDPNRQQRFVGLTALYSSSPFVASFARFLGHDGELRAVLLQALLEDRPLAAVIALEVRALRNMLGSLSGQPNTLVGSELTDILLLLSNIVRYADLCSQSLTDDGRSAKHPGSSTVSASESIVPSVFRNSSTLLDQLFADTRALLRHARSLQERRRKRTDALVAWSGGPGLNVDAIYELASKARSTPMSEMIDLIADAIGREAPI
ncbi:Anaphase-promoting complex subunit 1 [Porphyridium purpureum]|uniref:Anaphase-promoting complex subunit 1 n=1 Tax=Porphyridium purpureum TaxID=35688 RepID=A0A5J4Z1W9_PORPP|nr:Anaphase-promoting complex subunit 1 [Porphyridium purpureum]|eukprot:POR8788..scf208_2